MTLDQFVGLLLLAAAGMALALLVLPIAVVVPVAFSDSPTFQFPPAGYTLRWFVAALSNPTFTSALQASLLLAAGVSVCSVSLGTAAALALARGRARLPQWLGTLFLLPLLIPTVVSGLGFIHFFAVLGLLGSWWSIFLAHVAITIPFSMRVVLASLLGLGRSYEEAAFVLGATRLQTFRAVTMPMIKRGLVAGAVFPFIISFDEAVIALFLGGAQTLTFPVRLVTYLVDQFDPMVAAFATLLTLLTLGAAVGLERILGIENLSRLA
jgi:putative spermidine/putrescine transport system permease protein